MRQPVLLTLSLVAIVSLSPAAARAQWVVHALGGTVVATNDKAKTMTVDTDDGSAGKFSLPKTDDPDTNFDKEIKAKTVQASQYKATSQHVIVFFFGYGDDRTALAVEPVDSGATVEKVTGTVKKFDSNTHTLTIQPDSGAAQSITVAPDTLVDTANGVVEGKKFKIHNGEQIRILAESKGGQEQALLIRTSGV